MLRRTTEWNRLLKGLAIAFALVSSLVTPAVGEEAPAPYGDADPRSSGPRKEPPAEVMLPGVEPAQPGVDPYIAKDSIRPNMTLLADPASSQAGNTVAFPTGNEQVLIGSLKTELDATKAELAKTKQLIGEVIQEYKRSSATPDLPPLPDAEVRVFRLKNAPANDAADKVKMLIGTQPVRIAIDEASNGLIVFGKAESLPQVEELVMRLDDLAVKGGEGFSAPPASVFAPKEQAAPRRTLMLRVFWLADGVQELPSASEFLPEGVVNSLAKLGMEDVRLVTQTVNSLSAEEGGGINPFSTNVPAMLFQQPVTLTSSGTLSATTDGRAEIEMELSVGGPHVSCELKGSLATPLRHFMVLGTANSLIPEQQAMMVPEEAGEGGRGMGMPMGRSGEMGMGGAGFGGRGGGGGGGMMMGGMPAAKYNASRFAFVVQVIEAESFEPEGNGQ